MEKQQKTIFLSVLGILILTVGVTAFFQSNQAPEGPGKYDSFAMCLQEKGATFYGAFWCPHCQDQKKLFGKSAKLLPYVECSTPDGNGSTQICKDKNINGYPTWEFADESRLDGEVPVNTLSEKTGCVLPE